jgi:hypothetical protein
MSVHGATGAHDGLGRDWACDPRDRNRDVVDHGFDRVRGTGHDRGRDRPGRVSGAVFLLPVQLSVLGVPSPAVTPTNLIYNVVAGPDHRSTTGATTGRPVH